MTPKQFVKQYEKYGSVKAVARNTDLTYRAARKLYLQAVEENLMPAQSVGRKTRQAVKDPPVFHGVAGVPRTTKLTRPKRGTRVYILSSAQNNTNLHDNLWRNLLALRGHYNAQLIIARYTYIKSGLGASGDKVLFTPMASEQLYSGGTVAWDPRIAPYLMDERVELAPGLLWCGEWQRLPTTKRPLSGYEAYTGRKSGIFPHAKFELQSVASSKFEPTKFNYTTGTVTMRNYIVKGAGLQATFHHGYGAVVVEVTSEGDWFVRQINADSNGNFYDLDIEVADGEVRTGVKSVEGITFGDIHTQEADLVTEKVQEDMLSYFQPKYAFYHDVLNFGNRNHHERKDPFKRFERYVKSRECVRTEVEETMGYLSRRSRKFDSTMHIVVDSNHDRALERWLRESDWREDPINMEFFMESVLAKVRAIRFSDNSFHMLRYWFRECLGSGRKNLRFLDEDESFIICEDANGGIECGMHGHLGPNGARGGAATFAKMGRKANVGHTHQAGIHDGVYTAGTSSNLDMGYNKGPSSWSHSDILTYKNGKRTIITHWNGRWRANMKPV